MKTSECNWKKKTYFDLYFALIYFQIIQNKQCATEIFEQDNPYQ